MAYGHAERNLATLKLLQQKADEVLEQQAREHPAPATQPAESAGDSTQRHRDPRAPVKIPPRDARRTG
ncbi:MAG: hypothetical protein ACLP5E_21270 [Streptosporangiaceae bacterium]